MAHHPDLAFANWLNGGIWDGFRIGYDYTRGRPKSLRQNLCSALEKPQVIFEYLAKGCVEGRIMGAFPLMGLSQLHVSQFGVIPNSTPGKVAADFGFVIPRGS